MDVGERDSALVPSFYSITELTATPAHARGIDHISGSHENGSAHITNPIIATMNSRLNITVFVSATLMQLHTFGGFYATALNNSDIVTVVDD